MRPAHLTPTERGLAHLVNAFAMGTDIMDASLRRALERNTDKNAISDVPPSLGPIPVIEEEFYGDKWEVSRDCLGKWAVFAIDRMHGGTTYRFVSSHASRDAAWLVVSRIEEEI